MKNRLLVIIVSLSILFDYKSSLLSSQIGFNTIGYNIYTNNGIKYNAVAFNNTTGEIVAVGQNDNNSTLVGVYNSNGTLNRLVDVLQDANAECLDVTFNSQNKLFIVGINADNEGFVTSYNAGYLFDFYTALNEDNSEFHGVTIDRNGKIIAVGSAEDKGLIARFHQDGVLDDTFGTNGYKIETNLLIGALIYKAAAVDSQGRIVVVGSAHIGGFDRELIVRYTATGALDETFNAESVNGGPGYINSFLGNDSTYLSVVIDEQDRIIVVGKKFFALMARFKGIIIRYTSAGTRDATFGENGSAFVENGYGASIDNVSVTLNQVLLDQNGKIIVGGWVESMARGVVARHNTDGTLDTTFNNQGYTVFKTTANTILNGISFDSLGRIIAVGQSVDSPLVARFLSNGVLDAASNWTFKNYRENAQINNIPLVMLSA